MKRQLNREVTMTVSPAVMNAKRLNCHAISRSGVTLKYSLESSASPAGMRPLRNHEIAAAGATTSQKDKKVCMMMLRASSSQLGAAYRRISAVRLSSVQRPPRRAGAPSHISCEPTLVRMGVKRSDPAAAAPPHIVGNRGSHSDLAPALEANWADMQILSRPPRRVNVGSGLDGDVILDGHQIQRPGEISVVRALK